ncbi:hypothetical protein [Streptomyces sp. AP-93]|uniref:hypothetical protein n=1 Tax=Streptomyces sp. AP-93 TaxID=2929048 RepID=UPI001FAF64B7|nr:hypothetical protein [Streptomyces sp. AP-93]MCJ0868943.1 hypothetical protein [Streptomyces sp. AP-93]
MKSGFINWPWEDPIWTFHWWIADFPGEGTVFSQVKYRGRKIFHKASVPLIRVHYDGNHGPYKDSLNAHNLSYIKIYQCQISGLLTLAVDAYHKGGSLGRYHLLNRWLFLSDGTILPQLHSAGLQHDANHRHHVYWRFDFDIDGASSDLALYHSNWALDWGYGPGWWPIESESWLLKSPGERAWAVMNTPNGPGYVITPGPFDGRADSFSLADAYVLRYRGSEDLQGALGSRYSDDLKTLMKEMESTDKTDIVFWYIAHLPHVAHDNGDEWHVCGPILRRFGV